ncbi:distal membrane-arm assembly complex protein 2 [Ischnura elegans]|uniref:distal membrane-arm assembly complex protein 2 n=1 Tax=Ischnura elegans TaxID=197161 RepID=UPI001ED8ADFB|nr:distal membrane-arm assembly complex protein 2 [Ischnura elegans]
MLSQRLLRLNFKSFQRVAGSSCSYCSKEHTNKPTNWRVPNSERGEWYSNLSLFQINRKGPNTDWITFIQTEIDFRPSTIKRWWKNLKEKHTIFEERYIPERHQILGGDLSAAHFIVHRGGAVRFFGRSDWVRRNEDYEYDLPKFYDQAYVVEAIDASKMVLHFEGLINLMDLHRIKWLSFEGCPNIDDWCLDRVSGGFGNCLEYLDVRNCPKITARGLASLYRLRKLKKLLVSNDTGVKEIDLVCLMLEDALPKLEIEGIEFLPLPDNFENSGKESSEMNKNPPVK